MGFVTLAWVFVGAVTLHNFEEAIGLPSYWRHPPRIGGGRWLLGRPSDRALRFALAILTILAVGVAVLATVGGAHSAGACLIAGYGLAMGLNALFPHLLVTLVTRRYMPGTATGVLLTLPASIRMIQCGVQESYLDLPGFLVWGPVIAFSLAALIPLLFWVGGKIFR